jgi:hypothetical protein
MKPKKLFSTLLSVWLLSLGLVQNTHANYWGYNGIVPNQTYQVEFTPRIVENTTYWATMSVSSIGGYGGIQQLGSPNPTTDHVGLFSIWDSTSTTADAFVFGYNRLVTFRNYSFRFGGEGTGAQMLFNWAWVVGQPYRMAWRRYIEPGDTMARYEAFYYDPYDANASGWVWVGTIRKPVSTDGARNMEGFEGFSEVFGNNPTLVREIDIRNVWMLNLSNQWVNITHANMTDNRDHGVLTAIPGGWRHRSYDPNDVFTQVDNLPMLPDNSLSPLYVPYHINCGWGSTDVTISMQVADSLRRAFEPDAFWYGTSAVGYSPNTVSVAGVANAVGNSLLYQSRREGNNFGYQLFGAEPNVLTSVRLHFAETDFDMAGARVQDVIVNGVLVDQNLDIRALAGAKNKALVRDYPVTIGSNGLINISLQSKTTGVPAIVSGIEANCFPSTPATPSTLGNISTRLQVQGGDNVLIGGFIITGTQPKKVIVRALGPSLPLAGALADPVLELHGPGAFATITNDNWRSDQEAEIIATGIPPSNDLESAIVATLPANGAAYTAIVRGVNNGTGIGLVEAYDLDRTVDSKLANVSTRGLVQTGDNVLIAGTIVLGQASQRVIVRALGPSLNVPGKLADPTLELRDGNGALLRSNDNWRSDQEAEIIATGIPPSNDLESAIVATLPANGASYTAIVRGVNGTTGVAVVEVYALN